jgi:hypothetical protein
MTVIKTILAVVAALLGGIFLLPIVILAIPMWGMALLMRYCSLRATAQATSWEGIIEFDQQTGWKPKPNLDAYCSFAAGSFYVKTDASGWRGKGSIEQCDLLVLGDSFAFGFGVDDQEAFFSRLNSGLRVKTIGAPGYNMAQEVLWLERLATKLRGKLVVWFICFGNDLYDNLIPNLYQYRMPFVRQQNGGNGWEIVTSHIKRARWPFNSENNSRLKEKWQATFTERFLGQRAYLACEFLIERGLDICREAGANLAVMTIPLVNQLDEERWNRALLPFGGGQGFDPNLPDKKISDICSKLKVPFFAGRDYVEIQDHIERDGHWNKMGHAKIARLLQSLHDQHVSAGHSPASGILSSVSLAPIPHTL